MVKCKDGPYVCHEQHAEIVAALAADKQAADRATFDAIRAFTVLKDEVAALAAENERIRNALNVFNPNGGWVSLEDYRKLQNENAVLRAKVEWLMKADRLVVWNGTEWEIRHVQNK